MSQRAAGKGRQQDRAYWDRMARRWDQEIFNTLHHDKGGVIASEIRRSSIGARSIADFGCGTGIYVPLLSRLFDEVQGFERSQACVRLAKSRFERNKRVSIHGAGVASRRRGSFDVVLCVNVAIHPTARGRATVFRAVRALLATHGTLILVVPSLESATMVARVEQAARIRRGLAGPGDWDADSHPHGVVTIEGLPTKHFARAELQDTLQRLGLGVRRIRKVHYSWQSQGISRPPAAARSSPWDWIAVARR